MGGNEFETSSEGLSTSHHEETSLLDNLEAVNGCLGEIDCSRKGKGGKGKGNKNKQKKQNPKKGKKVKTAKKPKKGKKSKKSKDKNKKGKKNKKKGKTGPADSESTCECLTSLTLPWNLSFRPHTYCIASGTSVVFDLSNPPNQHNVEKVDSNVCNTTNITPSPKTMITKDNLPVGTSYFQCGIPGHCEAGMNVKIIV